MTALIVIGGVTMLTGWISIKMSMFRRGRPGRRSFLPVPVAIGMMVVGLLIALIGAANA